LKGTPYIADATTLELKATAFLALLTIKTTRTNVPGV